MKIEAKARMGTPDASFTGDKTTYNYPNVDNLLIIKEMRWPDPILFKNGAVRLLPEKKMTPSAPAIRASLISSIIMSGVL